MQYSTYVKQMQGSVEQNSTEMNLHIYVQWIFLIICCYRCFKDVFYLSERQNNRERETEKELELPAGGKWARLKREHRAPSGSSMCVTEAQVLGVLASISKD